MANRKLSPEEINKAIGYIHQLREKYEGIGQDFILYLEGLVHSNGLNYWDYVKLDSLMGLQTPRTNFPDEMIFVVYHQITELYFKLIKQEIDLLTDLERGEYKELKNWYKRIGRCSNYWKHLCNSFDIMAHGMDISEFKHFRMALLPASGFQSVQFRHIEIMSSNLSSLLHKDNREDMDAPLEKLYQYMYWKSGGIDMDTNNKTLTLRQFEKKYDLELQGWIKDYRYRNLAYLYYRLAPELKNDEKLVHLLREYDQYINIFWRMSHQAASSRHLPIDDRGTGGTNWRKYLPPKFQRVIFFNTIWTDTEKEEWGKAGVMKFFRDRIQGTWMKDERYDGTDQ